MTAQLTTTSTLSWTDRPLAETADAVLLDLDGVVWRGAEAIEHAAEVLATLTAAGIPPVYVTNNASRPPSVVSDQLTSLGIPTDPAHVMTASLAVTTMLRRELEPGARVLCVGGVGLHEAVAGAGFEVVTSADDGPAAVVQGYGPDIGWPQLTQAAYAVGDGAAYFATNLDATLPTERGMAVGNGSLVAAVVNATGVRPTSTGKPEPGIFHEAAELVGATHPVMVGDRLDTDLAGARNAGYPGLHVLTGVSQVGALLAAEPHERPSFLGLDLRALLQTHPRVESEGSGSEGGDTVCREARVRIIDDGVILLRSGGPVPLGQAATISLDELRALCVAFWNRADSGEPLDSSVVLPGVAVSEAEEQP